MKCDIDGFDLTKICTCKRRIFLIYQEEGKKERKKGESIFSLGISRKWSIVRKKAT
jgi:hypothetical protein